MQLDDLDLSAVPDSVVRDARTQWNDQHEAWVVSMDGATGLLVTNEGGAVWRFRGSVWTMPWPAMDTVSPLGENDLLVARAGGESYRFSFADNDERARFMARRRITTGTSRSLPLSDGGGARANLGMLLVVGVLLAVIGALLVNSEDAMGLGLLILVPAQICVGVAVIGWGVMLGTKAARE